MNAKGWLKGVCITRPNAFLSRCDPFGAIYLLSIHYFGSIMTTFSTPFEYESVPAFASLFFLFFSSVTKIRKLCDQLVRLYSNLRKTAAPSYLAFLPSEIFQEVCFFPHFFLSVTPV
jgi:hypothetical protein